MQRYMFKKVTSAILFALSAVLIIYGCTCQNLTPVVYTVSFSAPETQYAEVNAVIPVSGTAEFELMMPVWTPGYYRVENYASRIEDMSAAAPDGTPLDVEHTRDNRWRIGKCESKTVVVSYRALCNSRSVTTNEVNENYAVLNGAATFITPADRVSRQHEVIIELPSGWSHVITGLEEIPDETPNHFKADNYDILVDSPILAGNLVINEFKVNDVPHYVVDAGELGQWDSRRNTENIEKIVGETVRFWGEIPYKKYVFMNVFRRGGGGLEHSNSTLLTASSRRLTAPGLSWLLFVSHEYFHTYNVKRLRPIELGPFDYENAPRTGGLWIAEGFTCYYGDLLVVRSGLCTPQEYLSQLSSNIGRLQNTPGRLVQTLEQSSLDVWTVGMMGGDRATTISYYIKGPVAGFLLDAKIRKASGGTKSLDDVIRLAYRRYGGERGFTADEFRETAEEIAGTDMKEWFSKTVSSTEELDYTEALEWFGLQFAAPDNQDSTQSWNLEIRKDASELQKNRMQKWLMSSASR